MARNVILFCPQPLVDVPASLDLQAEPEWHETTIRYPNPRYPDVYDASATAWTVNPDLWIRAGADINGDGNGDL